MNKVMQMKEQEPICPDCAKEAGLVKLKPLNPYAHVVCTICGFKRGCMERRVYGIDHERNDKAAPR